MTRGTLRSLIKEVDIEILLRNSLYESAEQTGVSLTFTPDEGTRICLSLKEGPV